MNEPGIAVVSDQNQFRESVVQHLQMQGFQRLTEHRSAAELLSTLEREAPPVVLIDMDHGADEPLPLVRELRKRAPRTTVMIIGANLQSAAALGDTHASMELTTTDAHTLRALASLTVMTEQGTLLQPTPEAQQQHQLWSALTPRQRDVLGHLSTGSDNLKIAANLGISERAVKAHVSALLSVFSAENRTELAVLACRAGLRPPLRCRPMPASRPLPQPRSA